MRETTIISKNFHPRSQRIFSLYEKGEKKALQHFRYGIEICLEGIFLRKKLRNAWTAILKRADLQL